MRVMNDANGMRAAQVHDPLQPDTISAVQMRSAAPSAWHACAATGVTHTSNDASTACLTHLQRTNSLNLRRDTVARTVKVLEGATLHLC